MNKLILFLLSTLIILGCSKSGRKKTENRSSEIIENNSTEEKFVENNKSSSYRKKKSFKELDDKIILPFRDEGGVKIVKIKVNDIPLDFIFDTGASVISISETEARLLVKQGTLTEDDFIDVQKFVDANGDISEGLLVNLKEIDIQGYKLYNVKASIVQNSKAPLLLGQSLLEQFAKVTIDNKRKQISLE